MYRPINSYTKTRAPICYALLESNWEDLTVREIAEVLDYPVQSVRNAIKDIYKKTGYRVPYKKIKDGRPRKE